MLMWKGEDKEPSATKDWREVESQSSLGMSPQLVMQYHMVSPEIIFN